MGNSRVSNRILLTLFLGMLCVCSIHCTNPFAPKLSDKLPTVTGIGDQHTVEGVFQNFKYAYQFKDTLTYGQLLAPDFTFTYRDYDKGNDNSWGRDQDMLTTAGLFQAAQSLEIVWNEVVTTIGDSLVKDISRGFNLTITFSPTDVLRLNGRVELRIRRQSIDDVWMIVRWRDESNY
ncbi:MAG: hypothetical protein U0264_03660 [Candidatus Kapaibacterium sp.]